MTCIEKQQGLKLSSLEEKLDCKDRGHTGDGFPLCLVNDRTCPYVETTRYVMTVMGSFYPCRYMNTFEVFGREGKK